MALLMAESVLTYSGCGGRFPGKSPLPVERNYPLSARKTIEEFSMVRFKTLRSLALAILTVIVCCGLSVAQFETRSSIALPEILESVATGDFNHDGKTDVVVACGTQVQVFLGNGDGTFQTSIAYAYPTGAIWVAVADLNRDGNLDLIVASGVGNSVSVQFGNGDGTFQSPVTYNLTDVASFVGVADFNRDHKPDLILVIGSHVNIMFGNGDGTFQAPVDTGVTTGAAPAWGDLNGDGKLDLVVPQENGFVQEVVIYLGNGDGTFNAGASYSTGAPPWSVALADFSSTGKLDLAVGLESDTIEVLLGNGDGTFQSPVNYADAFARQMVVADFNGDGKLDLASANLSLPELSPLLGGVSVMMGNGDGTFQPETVYLTANSSWGLATADFNNDLLADIVNIGNLGEAVTLLNTGTVSFSPPTPLTFSPQFIGKTGPPLKTTLTNNGATPLAITSISTDKPFRLSSLSTCGTTVAPGASCEIVATFKPLTTGLFTGTVTIHDSASTKPQVVELVGSGTVVTVSPGQLNFPPQKVLTKSPPQTVTITNRSGAPVSVYYVQLYGGPNDYDFPIVNHCGAQIAAGASCTVDVTFDPFGTGKQGGVLNIGINGMGNPSLVYLRGTGK
jgi:hypothetical protein